MNDRERDLLNFSQEILQVLNRYSEHELRYLDLAQCMLIILFSHAYQDKDDPEGLEFAFEKFKVFARECHDRVVKSKGVKND